MKSDFQKYQDLQAAMHCMIRSGQFQSAAFQDAWQQSENVKARYGGMPPIPEDYDDEEQELCETANMMGTR